MTGLWALAFLLNISTGLASTPCSSSTVSFDAESLLRIFREPQKILREGQKFWVESVPYSSTKKWKQDPGLVLNLLLHEVYHVGFGKHQGNRSLNEAKTSAEIARGLLFRLQNEGMATYVGYEGRSPFPMKELEKDYVEMEKPERISELVQKFNLLTEFAQTHTGTEVNQRSFQIGNTDRAFYVVGAFMAKTIEEKLGREKLVSLVKAGPVSFVTTFNSVAPEGFRIKS